MGMQGWVGFQGWVGKMVVGARVGEYRMVELILSPTDSIDAGCRYFGCFITLLFIFTPV